jgi:hypothetical protein
LPQAGVPSCRIPWHVQGFPGTAAEPCSPDAGAPSGTAGAARDSVAIGWEDAAGGSIVPVVRGTPLWINGKLRTNASTTGRASRDKGRELVPVRWSPSLAILGIATRSAYKNPIREYSEVIPRVES